MKQIILISFLTLTTLFLQAQSDIIYPKNNESVIFNCEIHNVFDNTRVYYTKDSVTQHIEASAINLRGTYIELNKTSSSLAINRVILEYSGLYKDQDYDYYQRLYKSNRKVKIAGTIITAIGLGTVTAGYLMSRTVAGGTSTNGETIFWGGIVLINIGMPLWISGGIVSSNNKKAMEIIKRDVNLSFGTTSSGVGLVFRF